VYRVEGVKLYIIFKCWLFLLWLKFFVSWWEVIEWLDAF